MGTIGIRDEELIGLCDPTMVGMPDRHSVMINGKGGKQLAMPQEFQGRHGSIRIDQPALIRG